ncbi:Flocculation suppression protein [Coemansia javaensis]|uniref:Flocculation suppression protein n=1 Tax=Coemansia javaensis TaxID=2761396 RepID=A0A9W8HB58_9FUNG|nr:Flocculation suppression protein [Coemansia javaensis]
MSAGPRPSPDGDAGGGGDAPAAQPKRRLLIQKTHAAFVSKLYAMVADPGTDALIAWTAEGDCFKVTDPTEFARVVLPAYFKHGNWQSFVRQLNMYGFHKINDLAYGGVFGDTQLWMFKHPFFRRDELRLLQSIKRRGSGRPAAAAAAAAAPAAEGASEEAAPHNAADPHNTAADRVNTADLPDVDGASASELRECISALQQSNAQLWRENREMRAAVAGCQGALAGILRFLETAVVPPRPEPASLGAAAAHSAVADAFARLAAEVAPALPQMPPLPLPPPPPPPADGPACSPFRAGRYAGPPLPPLRSCGGPQSAAAAVRIASLSPPAGAPAAAAGPRLAIATRKRCSSSGSSSCSSCSSCTAGEPDDGPEPQVVLPPIANMVGAIAPPDRQQPGCWQPPHHHHHHHHHLALPAAARLHLPLPAKRPRHA